MISGGVDGASVAYHLTERGERGALSGHLGRLRLHGVGRSICYAYLPVPAVQVGARDPRRRLTTTSVIHTFV
jgi:hypothetical protein